MTDQYTDIEVSVTFKMTVQNMPEGVEHDEIAKMLVRDSRYDDGRYPFFTEMALMAVAESAQRAIKGVVESLMQAKHGREVIKLDDRGSEASLWHVESEQINKDIRVHGYDGVIAATVKDHVND